MRLDAVRQFRKLCVALRIVYARFAQYTALRAASLHDFVVRLCVLRCVERRRVVQTFSCMIQSWMPPSFAPGTKMFTGQFVSERKRGIVVVPPPVHQEQDMDDRSRASQERCWEAEKQICAASGSESPSFFLELAYLDPGSCHE